MAFPASTTQNQVTYAGQETSADDDSRTQRKPVTPGAVTEINRYAHDTHVPRVCPTMRLSHDAINHLPPSLEINSSDQF